ncbi:RidA family protein [Comamonadaceae bacterium G21597-S1]|nr:RidA family protein [Comamonadaceae bacterium G21597-S1]
MKNDITRTHTTARMSKIVRHGDLVYLCGQTSSGTDFTDMAGQAAETLRRVDALLEEAGTDKSRLLSALIHIRSMDDFTAMNAVWDAWLPPGAAPARTTVQAALASPQLLFEVTVVAAAG